MQFTIDKKKIRNVAEIAVILLFCTVTLLLDFIQIFYLKDEFHNKLFSKVIQQSAGAIAATFLLCRLGIQLFAKPQKCLYLIPCLIVAIDNFQFYAYFSGKMQLLHTDVWDFVLFTLYCLSVGLFEEMIFRGIIFSVLADRFSKDKKGLWKTVVLSSVIFGGAHLFNGISMATILQVGYTILTGGLFAFVLLKTKNILCCAITHAIYNFCGLLFDSPERFGLGAGVVLDIGTAITMLIVSVLAILFVLYSLKRYNQAEQITLYQRLGVSMENTRKEGEISE